MERLPLWNAARMWEINPSDRREDPQWILNLVDFRQLMLTATAEEWLLGRGPFSHIPRTDVQRFEDEVAWNAMTTPDYLRSHYWAHLQLTAGVDLDPESNHVAEGSTSGDESSGDESSGDEDGEEEGGSSDDEDGEEEGGSSGDEDGEEDDLDSESNDSAEGSSSSDDDGEEDDGGDVTVVKVVRQPQQDSCSSDYGLDDDDDEEEEEVSHVKSQIHQRGDDLIVDSALISSDTVSSTSSSESE